MADEPESFAKAKREKRVHILERKLARYKRAVDITLEDLEPFFMSYVANYRLQHDCDPDTSDVPLDYLEGVPPEESEE